jgi:cytochrome c peroxidase
LKTVPIPRVPNLDRFVRDRNWAIVLGKALFWDQQVGSDGLACASCHFHAGADSRIVNQLSPSLKHNDPARAGVFDPTQTGSGGPNYTLVAGDFPFHVLANPNDRESAVVFDSDDVVSSAGVFHADFQSANDPTTAFDQTTPLADGLFHVGDLTTRRVEPRNTPTMINAVFNFRNFWDGRANNMFNGQNPFGPRDPQAKVLRWNGRNLVSNPVGLTNCSLASQAVGPPLSDFEMSASGRTFPDLGRKLLPRRALAFQAVHADDSVLQGHIDPSGMGLVHTYADMVQLAFTDPYWHSPPDQLTDDGFTQMEANFALFWGLAIQLYETTLVSDDAPYDKFAEGDSNALTEAQRRGLDVFMTVGDCIACHKGGDFTGAGSVLQTQTAEGLVIERMIMSAKHTALYDNGFYNIGVRPAVEDLGVGANDPFGNPLSFTRQWQAWLAGSGGTDNAGSGPLVDRFTVNPFNFVVREPLPLVPTLLDLQRAFGRDANAVRGAFKTPSLRNVELTGPYFHNGGQATLDQVVAFYNRGGDSRRAGTTDTTAFDGSRSNLDADVRPRNMTAQQQSDLVEFLKSLTDERVRWEMAPFDHPELFVTNGHLMVPNSVQGTGFAEDDGFTLPAVGRQGRAQIGAGPLQPFHSQLP